MGTRLELWHSSGVRDERSSKLPFRGLGNLLLVAALASSGVVAVAAPANAVEQVVEYVSSADGVTTRWVRATRLEGSFKREERLTSGWYVCDSKVERLNLNVVAAVDLILGDKCDLTVGSDDRGAGILVPEFSQLTIWSGVQNTGRLVASGAPFSAGIGGTGTPRSGATPRSVSGNILITGGTVIANGGESAAGIGGGVLQANGHISILWRANVLARGGEAYEGSFLQYGSGPGIGVGGLTFYSRITGPGGEGQVRIDTDGVVQAFGGRASRLFGAGADIGYGGLENLPSRGPEFSRGVTMFPTVSFSDVVASGGGVVSFKDVNQAFVPAAPVTNLVPGSTVTFQARPDAGMKLQRAEWQGAELAPSSAGLFQLKVPRVRVDPGSPVTFSFVQASENPAAVQQLSERIAALPDTIVSISDADQVAAVTTQWLALNETERETLPTVASNRLRGAQQQAATVNHSSRVADVRVEGAELDWNVRLLATSFERDSAEYLAAQDALRGDRLAIALTEIRYVDTLTGLVVSPDSTGTLTLSGLNLRAYEDISATLEKGDESSSPVPVSTRDEDLQIESIAAGRYLATGFNTSDGGAGKGAAPADPAEALMIALACLVAVAALAAGGAVTQLSMRRSLRLVGK